MMIKTLTPLANSRARAMTRSGALRGRSMAALCLIGVLGAAACSDSDEGSTDGERAVRSNTPAESGGGTTTPRRDTTDDETAAPGRDPEGVDSDDINAIEDQDEDEIDGINGGGRRGGGAGGGRRNADDDEDTDAGVDEDAGVAEDAGVEVDAGGDVEVDAGGDVAVDAGDAG